MEDVELSGRNFERLASEISFNTKSGNASKLAKDCLRTLKLSSERNHTNSNFCVIKWLGLKPRKLHFVELSRPAFAIELRSKN